MLKSALTPFLAAATMVFAAPATAATPKSGVPVPSARPSTLIQTAQNAPPSDEITGSIQRPDNPAHSSGQLKNGLDALAGGDVARARSVRDGLAVDTLDRRILTWAIAVSGAEGVPSLDIAAAARTLQGWPGLTSLRRHSERALYRESASARQVIAAFGDTVPETSEGAIALARALKRHRTETTRRRRHRTGLAQRCFRQRDGKPDP